MASMSSVFQTATNRRASSTSADGIAEVSHVLPARFDAVPAPGMARLQLGVAP
jgi:hypothetical protein